MSSPTPTRMDRFSFGAALAETGLAVETATTNLFSQPVFKDGGLTWETTRACMRNYLIIRERVRAFRTDPELKAALEAARVDELAVPTRAGDESLIDLRAERHDVDALAARRMHFERLDQLAMEHLLGVRS